ncbi:aminopeptidase P family protein [Halieaceae bacterium IMCC8485]|uniref:Aminopeptidase P family protein n=1 Tax=Candidatus Seongchinamella marina TaxID=2518990 RepID=A0ABT3SWJ2_9GAMM|nr:Xaa-Pro peptidase family protein [Candidatus Seongchinamella marina]MCX2974254.1 aminopeptidase P family protein [Candidatus Seongchinamella marina]
MTIGVGGSTPAKELADLDNMTMGITPIALPEYEARIREAQRLMREKDIAGIYVNAGTSLYYFTGTRWGASERMVGAIIPASGQLEYIAPAFEEATLVEYMTITGRVNCWEEDESPYALMGSALARMGLKEGTIGIDEAAPFFIADGIRQSNPQYQFRNAAEVTASCRMIKSSTELALMQRAKNITLEVHKCAARILAPGVTTTEVEAFIHAAHKAAGASAGSYFCIVLFGEATAYPHGVKDPQVLQDNDMVLIDTGCQLEGYISDITRSYVYGEISDRQRQIWNLEKEAQAAAFAAAKIGQPCSAVDTAARKALEAQGLGPGYNIPGLPHRTGHGIGLDIHEWPYLVKNETTKLAPGMCFSNEPMICIPGEFGIRHEDHFYMTESGPKWFTEPAYSVDDPFGYEA